MIIGLIIGIVFGFLAGALVTRNNVEKVNKVVLETVELLDKAEAELKELKSKKKPVKRKTTSAKKKPVKKPQVD